MNFFKNVWQQIKKGFSSLFGKKKPVKLIKMEDGSFQTERMPTGNSNGLLSLHERNKKNRFENKQKKRKKANKIARASRKYNYRQAA